LKKIIIMCLFAMINVANSRTITVEYDGKIDTILLSEEDIRYMEVQESDDQNVLAEFARNDPDNSVRVAAVKKLHDQALLAKVATNSIHTYTRQLAIRKIENQSVHEQIALNANENVQVRSTAIFQIKNQNLLLDIFKNETNCMIRVSTLYILDDKSLIQRIAENDKDESVRQSALARLDDLNKKNQNDEATAKSTNNEGQ